MRVDSSFDIQGRLNDILREFEKNEIKTKEIFSMIEVQVSKYKDKDVYGIVREAMPDVEFDWDDAGNGRALLTIYPSIYLEREDGDNE